ncbi:MAG TPA: TonB-dependent receptor [Gemmatimonadales bacterium]|nr:TonB-dependent receptor [Gemmatimonadales bacterium]
MRPPARILPAALALAAVFPARATAQDSLTRERTDTTHIPSLQPIVVTGRADNLIGSATTASEGQIGAADFRLRPLTREGELLETVPGMIVTQHSGDGKANQYFIRGFNLDHGTDFSTSVEGMPVNMPTHAHGQGYTDLNFLIPELVDHISYQLGIYHAEVGDFGSAGAAEFSLARRLARPFITTTFGENGMARVAAGGSIPAGGGDLLAAAEVKHYNGPWDLPEELRKLSGVLRYSWEHGSSAFSILAMGYHNEWNASDQIPLRAVSEGLIDRFGQIDSTDGGITGRFSLSGSWHHVEDRAVDDVELHTIYSHLSLFSDFEYFLTDSLHGDQFNQAEQRTVVGGSATRLQQVEGLGITHVVKVGLQTRADFLGPVGLYHTEARVRLGTVRQDDVQEWSGGLFVEVQSFWRSWFRSVVGLRGDGYAFHVESDIPVNSGSRQAGIVSPKANLIFTPAAGAELYLSGGLGFHSNDARGTTITVDPSTHLAVSQVSPLVRSRGAEFGVRANPVAQWRSTLALWALDLDSELLFTGDGGTTEPSAASRRRGVTWANFYRPIPQLALDADVSLSRARFAGVPGNEDHIPGALENVVAAGATWSAIGRGLFGSVRLRHFGAYPLIEDNSVRAIPTTLVNAEVGYLLSGWRLEVSLLNGFNAVADDIQYYYISRLPGEPLEGVNDIHFHPVEPRQVRVTASVGL